MFKRRSEEFPGPEIRPKAKESPAATARRAGVAALAVVAALAAAEAAAKVIHNGKDSRAERALKQELLHAYVGGSVRLTRANEIGVTLPANGYAFGTGPEREVISVHIASEVDKATARSGGPAYSYGLAPRERVLLPGAQTAVPGAAQWAVSRRSKGDAELDVSLAPYTGKDMVTGRYRLYLTAAGADLFQERAIGAEYYAGTVDITGADGRIDAVGIEQEYSVPAVRLVSTRPDSSILLNGANSLSP